MYRMFLPVFLPSLRYFRLGGFGVLDIFIIGYFGVVFDLAFHTRKNFVMYVFSWSCVECQEEG